jgi:signal transduction histidine kinase
MTMLSSLTNRIFFASALLVAGSTGITLLLLDRSVSRRAEENLRAGLAEAASLVDQFSRTRFTDFVVKAELIAGLPVLMGATATGDGATVQPIAEEYQARIGADLFVVIGRGTGTLARAGRVRLETAAIDSLLAACDASPDGTVFVPSAKGLLHVAAVPIEADLGTLVVGQNLDRDAALAIREGTNSEIAFVAGTTIVASSFDPARMDALAASGAASGRGVFTVPLGNEEFIGRTQAIDDTPDGPVALVLRSRSEHLRFLSRLRWQIAMTALAAILVATVFGYLIARTVTRPLRALTTTMAEMAASGTFNRAHPVAGRWDDEDARLVATTFDRLMRALEQVRREAALRDRLSSLGRLSAAVAHEIRNPLMIIKSTVRSLRRDNSPEVAAAAASLDEEVVRLDRVVSDVLDFARPVSIALARADLGTICRTAVQAVEATADGLKVEVAVPAEPLPSVTDAERLRAVLVNVLQNAQHAVRARPAAPEPPAIVVHVERAAPSGWRIDVRDKGVGIDPADLPGIFEPFFTRRAGGSGLGLALAKNVVEALGGTIAVASRPGIGTVVTIDLPDLTLSEEVRS